LEVCFDHQNPNTLIIEEEKTKNKTMVQNLTSLQISSHSLWQKEITQIKIIKI